MTFTNTAGLQKFKNLVGINFQLYNSLFTSLPFHRVEHTGILLSLLLTHCEEGYKKKQSPAEILESFFKRHTNYTTVQEQTDLLFRFVQYAERQVVLFDALEDAAYTAVNDMQGPGSVKQLLSEVQARGKEEELIEKIKHYSIRPVLTAHPTQFYPGTVLGIIHDLSKALQENNAAQVNTYLQQLGKTAFFKKQKPTPYDEAVSLSWYLENVFYAAAGRVFTSLKNQLQLGIHFSNAPIRMGFWPGGDRDGNPFVTTETTLRVAEMLRGSIIKCYYLDVRKLKRRLTFAGVDILLASLEKKLYENIFIPGHTTTLTKGEILSTLFEIREILIHDHNGLFLQLTEQLINRVQLFGLYFASLDIRQDSSVHGKLLAALLKKDPSLKLPFPAEPVSPGEEEIAPEIFKDTLDVMKAVKQIQQQNGEEGCNRYIISHCCSAKNVMEVYQLFLLSGWQPQELTMDIVPLFETVEDLQEASAVMRQLYTNEAYRAHLTLRKNRQTIMLGFSDGTKDGGYLMANWGIYKAKESLSQLSKEYGVEVIFFDGRGGPPARGGGKTHKFYASMGKNIANNEIQLTVQGQTVSSNFGTVDAAQFNMEQLLNAGISNDLFSSTRITLEEDEEKLVAEVAEKSFRSYSEFKNHPGFLPYLQDISPLKYYSETNIASRPSKRGSASRLTINDLRAIPFVGAWSQLKQNVTGYYGVGTALKQMEDEGKFAVLKKIYHHSLFIKTLMDNCEMAMKKCFFPLTAHFAGHPQYGEIWEMICREYELTQKYVLKLSGKQELMEDYPVEQLSIQMRERIVLPLSTIQQFAISKCLEMNKAGITPPIKSSYEKLIIRCSFGIINAARNSA
ncbi:MAG: phosphoenolpyruvate carboxylase [Ferruginibacter sp.]